MSSIATAFLGGAASTGRRRQQGEGSRWNLHQQTQQLRLVPPAPGHQQGRIVSLLRCTRPERGQQQVLEKKQLRTSKTTLVKKTLDSLAMKLNPVRIFIWRQGSKALVGALLLAAAAFAHANYAPKIIPYSTFVHLLEERLILKVSFEEDSAVIFFNVVPDAKRINLEGAAASQQEQQQQKQEQEAEDILEEDAPVQEAKMKLFKAEEESKQAMVATGTTAKEIVLANLAKGMQLVKEKLPPPEYEYRTRRIIMDEQNLINLIKYKSSDVEYTSIITWTSFARTAGRALVNFSIPLSALVSLMHLNGVSPIFRKRQRKSSSQAIRFEDVAGVDSARLELEEVVACLRGTSNFRKVGAQIPKGVLLVGPPGTGKTLLARAVAGEAGIPFYAASASEFVEVFVGKGAARVRELFNSARKNSPSIVFIDEIDAVGGKRGRAYNDEKDQTLNQLLTEMDGFEGNTGILVIAATNRLDALDPALCRPGRFSRKVHVKAPDFEGRKQVLAVHMRDVAVSGDAEAIRHVIAAMTTGFVGADLANVVNEAALLAARYGQAVVTLENFKEAVHRAKNGINAGASEEDASDKPPAGFDVIPAIAQ